MTRLYTRRKMLRLSGQLAIAGTAGTAIGFTAEPRASDGNGLVAGQIKAAEVGNQVLRDGGNAIDAVVAAALTAAVVVPQGCGLGGYGGHMVIALKGGRKITAIDFNSAAPSAATPDMFPLGEDGKVRGRINEHGWLATGVPGTLAGLQLALDRYGTRPLRELAGPAIHLAYEGFPISDGLARSIRGVANELRSDSASAELVLRGAALPQPGDTFRNPDMANMLKELARQNSVESFYRGEIGRHIAQEFAAHGGLVTAKDMAAYRAREVQPLELKWRGFTIRTAPLTAGGLTVLQALSTLKALAWDSLPGGPSRTHRLVEALRVAWSDRLQLLGDPEKAAIPVRRLLSEQYAHSSAASVESAVKERKPLSLKTDSRAQSGTVHLNSADRQGNLVALTLTHGNSFGACVTVKGLGLALGHGMSRFDPQPGHPNAPGPGKRPLHNMCPTIVLQGGKPILALGGTGGRLIPNAIFGVLTRFIGQGESIDQAMAAPRLHTDGNLDLSFESKWPEGDLQFLKELGYYAKIGNSANAHAIYVNPQTGVCHAAAR